MNLMIWSRASAILGGVIWLILFAASASNDGTLAMITYLLLFAVLVITPLALPLVAPVELVSSQALPYRAALVVQPFVAALVIISFFLPAGIPAALCVLGWLLLTSLVALFGLFRLLSRNSLRADELCIDAGLFYLPVGAVWLIFSRLGANPLGFDNTIVILTAVHFHYAGFGAPILAGLAGRRLATIRPAAWRLFRPVAAGVIAGIALVAAGITLARFTPLLEVAAAVLFAASLLGLAGLVLFVVVPATQPRFARGLLAVSAGSLLVTMPLAGGYTVGRFAGFPLVGIPRMVEVHGWMNALGFVLCGLLAWTFSTEEREPRTLKSP
ncbi:MAG TPA: YndJ family protein [Roseiflexaceae bacterium]